MRRAISRGAAAALVSIVLCGLSFDAVAQPTTRPFKGSFDGQFTEFHEVDGVLTATLTASHNSTHMGRGPVSGQLRVNGDGTVGGTITVTAADGSAFVMTMSGNIHFEEGDDSGSAVFTLVGTINSGTGRFEGISGALTVEGVSADLPEPELFSFGGHWSGTTTY